MPADVAITLDGLSHIVTPELARDLSTELIAMLNHSRAHIRKRAILTLYKLLVNHPEAISHARVRLEEKLNDSDPGEQVGSSVVIISQYLCSRCSRYS
jgi:AP-3 complex subunit delta-1